MPRSSRKYSSTGIYHVWCEEIR